ncbi:MAG: XrtA/PEP-CTERM system TPR-repeat protein PrsT [Burkholderiales bacterium]
MTHFRTWLLCAAVALTAACSRNEPAQLVDSAKAYLAKKDYAAAAIQLRNALQKDPTNGDARYLFGIALNETGDFVSAEKELRRALEYKQPEANVVPELARAMRQMGESKKLVAEFGATKLDDPAAQAALKSEIGYAHLALGQVKPAREAFAAALAARPGDGKARAGQARIRALERDVPGAMKVVDEVLAQSPAQPEALALKADLLVTQGQLEPARQTLAQLIQAQPVNGQARFMLTSLLIGEKRFDDARTEIEAMKKAVPRDIRSRYLEALLEYRQGNPAKAKESILQVLKVAPEHAPSQLLAGAIELQLKAYVTAEDYLRRVVARHPQNIVARRLLAAAYLGAGQSAKAGEVLEVALKLAPNDPLLLRLAGEATLSSGDFARASQFFEQAAARDKDNAAVRTRLAQVRFATGDEERAFKDLEAASAIDRDQYQADLALVLAHMRKREYDKALAAAAMLEKKQPNNPLTFNVKGGVYLGKGDRANARASFAKALQLKPDYLPAAANLARMDLADKQPEAARGRFESIVAKDPKNDQALLALAELQAATNVPPKEILATVERAISANPKSVRARLSLISYHLSTRDTKAALAAAQSAVNAIPESRELLSAFGRVQFAAGETRQAVATFNKLATMMPDSPVPLMLAARAYVAAKDYDGAVQSLRKALGLSPDRLDVHREAIAVLLAAGKPDEAIADAKTLQKQRPKEAAGYMFEGEVLATQQKFAEAARAYGEAAKRQSSPVLVARQHSLLEAAGKHAEGEAVAARWLKENPKDHVVRLYLADRDLRRKDYKAAARTYREIVALQPENPVALNNLAWTLSQLKDPAALEYAEKAYARAPSSPAVADTLGWILVERGDTKRGVEILAKAAAGAPNVLEIRLHYAKALAKAGDKAAAKQEIESALQAAGQSPVRAEAEELLKQL